MTQDDWSGILVLSKSSYIDLGLDGSIVRWTHYDWVNSGILQSLEFTLANKSVTMKGRIRFEHVLSKT